MIRPQKSRAAANPNQRRSSDVPGRLAWSLLGQTVSLLVDDRTTTRGVVTNVLTETGTPEIVVHGTRYHLNRILTVTPVAFAA